MLVSVEVHIGKMKFTSVTNITIESTWKKFTDVATIQIPKAVYYRDESGQLKPVKHLGDFIKVGDEVEIKLGYDNRLFTEFKGYVARSPRVDIPYEIICEDEMWQLKRKEVSVSIRNATVKQIVEAVAPGYEIDCLDELYGDFSMKNTTPVKIFDELKRQAGIYTFFRDGRLVCGKVYTDEKIPEKQPVFEYGHNIIESNLQYIYPEEAKVKLYAMSEQPNGKTLRIEVGEDGGDIEYWSFGFGLNKEQLKKQAEVRLQTLKTRGGYRGTVKSFGWPRVQHGQVVQIIDSLYEERHTKNFADVINIEVGPDIGYKRTVDVGKMYIDGEFK